MKNYLKKTWFHPALVKKASPIHGYGIFTSQPILKDSVVMIWGGILIPRDRYEDIWQHYRNGTVVQVSEDYFIGAPITDPESLDESLNHSCDPNTWLIDEVTVVARRDILANEEITLDSATWNDDDSEEYSDNDICTCGSFLCRGKITADDWRSPLLQKIYTGHFSPFLQSKILVSHRKNT